jgi:hypothetical protein
MLSLVASSSKLLNENLKLFVARVPLFPALGVLGLGEIER